LDRSRETPKQEQAKAEKRAGKRYEPKLMQEMWPVISAGQFGETSGQVPDAALKRFLLMFSA
jgi:hypothetical protein